MYTHSQKDEDTANPHKKIKFSDGMKGARSVCLLCRHRLATSISTSTPTSTANSTRRHNRGRVQFTTKTIRHNDTNASIASEGSSNPANPPEEATTAAPDSGPVRKIILKEFKIEPRKNLHKRPPEKPPGNLDILFQKIVAKQQNINKDGKSPVASTTSPSPDITLVRDISRLYDMVKGGTPEVAYAYLKNVIYPTIQQPGVHIPQIFYTVVLDLMKKMVVVKKDAMLDTKLPSVAEIFQVYVDIEELKPKEWAEVVGELVQTLIGMSTSTEDYPSIEAYERHLATRASMLNDLVKSWKVLSTPAIYNITTPPPDRELADGFWFPTFNEFVINKFAKSNDFSAAFSSVFPRYHFNQLGAPVAALTIATYVLLQDRVRSNANARRSTARFMSNVAYLIARVEITDDALQNLFSKTFPGLKDYIMSEWPEVKAQLKDMAETGGESRIHNRSSNSYTSTSKSLKGNLSPLAHRVTQAYYARNLGEVDRVWEETVGLEKNLSQERIALLRENVDLINSFVNVYMASSHPGKALAAWNVLKKIGLRPDLKTWNAMLDGCKKARNVNGIKNIWAKLVGAGIKLDIPIWTTRVSGLVESGDIEGGLQALEEMATLWKQSLKDQKKHAVQPTIEPVNAALAGLTRHKRTQAVERLLGWANRQGLKPDIFTFNTILRPMIREERREDVQRLFAMMNKQGVRADAATFTIVLDAALTRIELSSSSLLKDFEEAQKEAVAHVLSQMEAVGLETNLYTYGKMIYLLLQSGGDRAQEAIKAVLGHLWENGHELSPHIYTMLAEHYFARRPPDLASVDALLRRQGLLQRQVSGDSSTSTHNSDGSNNDGDDSSASAAATGRDLPEMDRVFHDRVVKGYALAADDPGSALDLFYRLSAAGYLVTLGTQVELLRALLRHGRWDDARALVDHTKKRFKLDGDGATTGDLFAGDENASFSNHGFWTIAEVNGLL